MPETKRTLLVVDDEESVRRLFTLVLSQAGYAVSQAANGIEAMAVCGRSPVDAVLLDLVMPEREGIETLRLLRRDYPHIPVAVVSGVPEESLLRAATRLGARTALPKPIRPAELLETVQNLLH
jgi:CheY-like chemotaxis protein